MSRMIKELLILLLVVVFISGSFTLAYRLMNMKPKEPDPEDVTTNEECQHKTTSKTEETISDATCIDSGFYYEVITCTSTCKQEISREIKSKPPKGHQMNGNVCKKCDYITDSQGFNYILNGSGYMLAGKGSNNDEHVIIPATYDGLPVNAIGTNAFKGAKLKEIDIPDSVSSIGAGAFANCEQLKTVNLGNSVTYVGDGAFTGCKVLEYSDYDNAKYLGNNTNPYIALITATNKDITECNIHEDAKLIAGGAFNSCYKLREIVIPDRVKSIGEKAFFDCTNLLSIKIGKALTSIKDDAFLYCHKLVEVYNLADDFVVGKGSSANGYVGYYALDVYKSSADTSKLVPYNDGFVFYENGAVRYLVAYHGTETAIELPTKDTYEMYSHALSRLDITSVVVPKGVKVIGNYAFSGCEKLATVSLPDGLEAITSGTFANCVKLAALEIPNTVNSIGSHAFEGCKILAEITIPAGVEVIESYTFMNCPALATVTVNGSIKTVYDYAFYGCKALASFVKSNSELAIADTVTIGDYAFYGCEAVSEIDLSSAMEIGAYAFSGSGINALVLPSNLKFVGDYSFSGCKALAELTVAERDVALNFGEYVFSLCTSLGEVAVEKGVAKINKGMFLGCTALTDVTLDKVVTVIGDEAFYGCSSLMAIDITSIVTIGDKAFADCVRYSQVVFGDKLGTIGAHAFENCFNIVSIIIPKSVHTVGDSAFYGCLKLVEVYQLSIALPDSHVNNSCMGKYADKIYTSLNNPSKIVTVGDYVFYVNGSNRYLLTYIGRDTEITLPASLNGQSYEIGAYAFYRMANLVSVDFSGANVTAVGEYAFNECPVLTTVNMADSVKTIGNYAFYNCIVLNNVNMPAELVSLGDYAFSGCKALDEVVFGSNIVTIGNYAFNESGLTKVNTGSASVIGKYAFYGCSKLTDAVLDGVISYVGEYAFNKCSKLANLTIASADDATIGVSAFVGTKLNSITLPEGVVTIRDKAFYNVATIESISLPSTLVNIAENAFYATTPNNISVADGNEVYSGNGDCLYNKNSLTVVLGSNNSVIPSEARFIADNAFLGCNGLDSVELKNIVKIGQYAFSGCTQLTALDFGTNLISLGKEAFKGCVSVQSLVIPASLTTIPENAFASCTSIVSVQICAGVETIEYNAFSGCNSIEELILNKGLVTIGNNAFEGCSALISLVIPEGVNTIGDSAFSNCDALTTVVINEGVTLIEGSAFSGCKQLASITIPYTVIEIGNNAFKNCDALKNVYYDGTKDQFEDIKVGSGNDKFTKANETYTKDK